MRHALLALDESLAGHGWQQILALAICGVLIVGAVDYLVGYEILISFFYLGPIAVATWYAGRQTGLAIAALCCVSVYVADVGAGHPYSNSAIPVWNALIHIGFFVITALLLSGQARCAKWTWRRALEG
jgi:hypothetical protein